MAGDAASPQDELRALLEQIKESLGLDATVVVEQPDDEHLVGRLEGEDLGLFIGRRGQTIEAVQHLAQRIIARDGLRVVVDAAGYRERREQALHRQADQAADDAVRTDRAVALDAMTASERRTVHEYLRDRGDVDTHSEGDEPDRHLVVTPKPAG